MQYRVTSPGKPDLIKSEAFIDHCVRIVHGDNVQTTQKMMLLADGSIPSLKLTYKGVTMTITRIV